jgi:sugar fermentation stimulation protein A
MGADQHRRPHRPVATARVAFEAPLRGRLLRRYKRFLADVETEDGGKLTVHCPDPGSMRGCAVPGAAVRCSVHDDPRRKLAHTLEMIRVGRIWVGVNTTRANTVAARALAAGTVPALRGYARVQREVRAGDRTRLDFLLTGRRDDPRPAWVEVKSATLAEGRTALFPDSVTERGRRHVERLAELARDGQRAVLLYVVQRADCLRVAPADAIDPAYSDALRAAVRAGIETFALGARVTARGITVTGRLPVVL